jgi:hypothetical protein
MTSEPKMLTREEFATSRIRPVPLWKIAMLVVKERRAAFRTIEGWAISVPLEVGAIQECEKHGWMRDRADPNARERAVDIAREDPPQGVSPEKARAAVKAS